MGKYLKQAAIYIGLLLVCSTYSLIAPFYPKVAKEKGISLWLIGLVFSLNPIGNLLSTPFIGKYLNSIGRKRVLMSSYVLTALSLFLLSPIEFLDGTIFIIFSVIGRLVGGVGASCLFTSMTSIFISEYPDQMETMLGRMEAAIGIGLILGPVVGAGLYSINLLAALITVGGSILIFSVLAFWMLGEFREYQAVEINIPQLPLLKKQVIFKQKIFLGIFMNFLFMFSFGFIDSLLEIHLASFGFSVLAVSLCFVLQSAIYFVTSLSGGYLFKSLDKRAVMVLGVFCLALAYLMLAPLRYVFPNSPWVIVAAMPLFGFGEALTYMFSIPFMIRSAVEFGYKEDDILTDIISTFAVFGQASGEIVGPLFGGFFTEMLGIQMSCMLASGVNIFVVLWFLAGTGCIKDVFKRSEKSKTNTSVHDSFM